MAFLNNVIRLILFVIWAFIVYYISKQLGFEYDPDSSSFVRKYIRVILIIIIFGGGYFIRMITVFKHKDDKNH